MVAHLAAYHSAYEKIKFPDELTVGYATILRRTIPGHKLLLTMRIKSIKA